MITQWVQQRHEQYNCLDVTSLIRSVFSILCDLDKDQIFDFNAEILLISMSLLNLFVSVQSKSLDLLLISMYIARKRGNRGSILLKCCKHKSKYSIHGGNSFPFMFTHISINHRFPGKI